MRNILFAIGTLAFVLGNVTVARAQTDGTARMDIRINDYGPSGARHWTVVWVTYENGNFIKSLRKQGPGWTTTHWDSHCRVWNTARGGSAAGSQALDGYSSATAADYAGTNNPIVWTWNCRDTNNVVVPDGNYKLWIQYAEDSGQGPYTTNGLTWTKGPLAATNTYPNMGANFTSLRLIWSPSAPPAVAPTITSAPPTASGTVGVPYHYTCTATGTAPVTFNANGLPTGLAITTAGIISGTPTAAGNFTGSITAANGTLPNATQAFAINISVVPARIGSVALNGANLVMIGQGPPNGIYSVLAATEADPANPWLWTAIATGTFDDGGQCRFTNAVSSSLLQRYYRLRIP